jgi:hypothetical protein
MSSSCIHVVLEGSVKLRNLPYNNHHLGAEAHDRTLLVHNVQLLHSYCYYTSIIFVWRAALSQNRFQLMVGLSTISDVQLMLNIEMTVMINFQVST